MTVRADIAALIKDNSWSPHSLAHIPPADVRGAFDMVVPVDTRAAAIATTVPSSVSFIRTAGYATVGDGGHGFYKRLASDPSSANKGYFQSTDGSWWALVPQNHLYIEQFGGKADYPQSGSPGTVTDNLQPFNDAIAYLTAHFNPTFLNAGRTGASIKLGYGIYYVSDTITQQAYSTCIEGMGIGISIGGQPTQIVVAPGKSFWVEKAQADGTLSGLGNGFSILRNMAIISLGAAGQTTKHGIDVQCGMIMENCRVTGVGGDGIHISADTFTQGGGHNANLSSYEMIWSDANVGHGFYVEGGDANVIFFERCSAIGNGGQGFYDNSFLGNSWVSCHAAGNTAGAFLAPGLNQRGVFVGCYTEGGGTVTIGFPNVVLGGFISDVQSGTATVFHGSGFSKANITGGTDSLRSLEVELRGAADSVISIAPPALRYKVASNASIGATTVALTNGNVNIPNGTPIFFRNDPTIYNATTGISAPSGTVTISPPLVRAVIAGLDMVGDQSSNTVNFAYQPDSGTLVWQLGLLGATIQQYIQTDVSNITCGRSANIPIVSFVYPQGVWLGSPGSSGDTSTSRFLGYASAAPTSGTFAQGDRVLNSAPTAGGSEGWVCVTAGTPGTGKTFGSISA